MKQKQILLTGVVLIGSPLLLFLFQNCGNGFSASSDGSATSSSVDPGTSQVNTLSVAPLTTSLYTVEDLNFKLTGALANSTSTIKWSNVFSGTTPCTDDVNDDDQTEYGVNCTVPGDLIVNVSAIDNNGILRSRSFTAKVAANPNPSPSGGDAASFTITSGTGTKSWNLATAPIELYIGMTLTITNGDTVPHQLHVDRYDANSATNGHPCAHEPDPMAPGGTYACVVTKTYDPATDPPVYDHIAGSSARFYLKSYDGTALYSTNCASCHGALATSTKLNKTCPDITSAIGSVADMKAIPALANLTLVQKKAIAFALKK